MSNQKEKRAKTDLTEIKDSCLPLMLAQRLALHMKNENVFRFYHKLTKQTTEFIPNTGVNETGPACFFLRCIFFLSTNQELISVMQFPDQK